MSNEVTITQMNEAIARFDGWETHFYNDTLFFRKEGKSYFNSDLKYHTSWDWLMPVVEKIEKDYCNIIELVIYSSSCCIDKWNPHTGKYDSFIHETGNKRDAVYKAVYQFITWLNQQKQNNDKTK